MSRIGKQPILIPAGVAVVLNDGVVTVKGPKGELKLALNPVSDVSLNVLEKEVVVTGTSENSNFWGLYRALIANMVKGVVTGFKKNLEIIGVGYRASMKGQTLVLNIGFSHPIEFTPPAGVSLEVLENTKITVSGADRNIVGLVASQIRAMRKPEPYKGKGIKYSDEFVRRKPGKAAAKTA